MRGLKVRLMDVSLHEEPVYRIGVRVSIQWVDKVIGLIIGKRGCVVADSLGLSWLVRSMLLGSALLIIARRCQRISQRK